MKKIQLYAIVYNGEDILPFFLDYYSFVDKMTFIDSNSTDNTLRLIKDHEVIQTGLTWYDHWALHNYRNTIWRHKKTDADIIFFPDVDEFFYKENLREFLEITDYDFYHLRGYEMVSDTFPKVGTNILNIKMGVECPPFNKYTIFKNGLDIVFPNAHEVLCESKNYSDGDIKLLHYRYLGVDAMKKRRDVAVSRNLDSFYMNYQSDTYLALELERLLKEAKQVI